MNIQSRLQKLEEKHNPGPDDGYCRCTNTDRPMTDVILPQLDESEEHRKMRIAEHMKEESCDACGRIIAKQLIVVEGVPGYDGPLDPRLINNLGYGELGDSVIQ